MDFNKYQALAKTTAIYPNQGNNLPYAVLGLLEESGEVLEKTFDTKNLNKEDILKELGDILWYSACICTEMQVAMHDIYEKSTKLSAPKSIKALNHKLFLSTTQIAGKAKKVLRDDNGIIVAAKKEAICMALAETLHCIQILSSTYGSGISEVAQKNIDKLLSRKEKGTLKGSGDHR